MPLSRYFGGHGERVMHDMKDRYGAERGERVFYATSAKRRETPRSQARRPTRRSR